MRHPPYSLSDNPGSKIVHKVAARRNTRGASFPQIALCIKLLIVLIQLRGQREKYIHDFHGLMTDMPAASKGAVSRDATRKPLEAAIAAIYPSGVGNPRPAALAVTANVA